MPKIKYAIFDVGQTIYPFTLRPLNSLMKEKTAKPKTFENGHSAFNYDYNPYMKGQLTNQEFAEELCLFCCVPYTKDILPQINKALHEGCGTPYKESLQAIKKLQSSGIEIGILSNALPLLHDTKINLVKNEYVFTSYEMGLLKPDTLIYQKMAEKLNTPYSEILFIDDKKRNIIAAEELGIHGITYQKETILKDIAEYLPSSIIRENFISH